MALVLVFGAATQGLEALDRHRLFHLSALGVRQGRCSRSSLRRSSPAAPVRRPLSVPLKAIACAAVAILLVFAQPDVGTALVYIAVLAAALFVAGVRWLHLATVGASR